MAKKRSIVSARSKSFTSRTITSTDSVLNSLNLRDDEFTSALNNLEDAWENLPNDFTAEERSMFLDIAEKVIKLEKKINPEIEYNESSN